MRTRTLRVVIVAAGVSLLSGVSPVAAKRAKPVPCAGRYLVQGGPLLPGAPASQVDAVTVGPSSASLSLGCDAGAQKGRVKLKALRSVTMVAVAWKDCGGLTGMVRLKGKITEACATLTATLRAGGLKRPVSALRSTCGDGVLDAGGGETCDPAGIACPDGSSCTADCTCAATTTTTLPAGACNVLAQSGCAVGQKCTWIEVADTPAEIGRLGCVADGTVPTDGACSRGPVGETTGFDDCAAGLICVDGACRDICGFDGSPAAACATSFNCTRYAGLFSNGDADPIAGACTPGCDPVTQQRANGSPCPVGQGCYLLTGATETTAVCAGAGTLAHGQAITGTAFANSCLPGHQPRRRDQVGSTLECGALCKPADVYMGNNVAAEGGLMPYTCEANGAAAPSDAMNGESCRYWWAREPFDTVSPFSNTVGWCFKHATFQYDSNGDMTLDAPFPRCTTLTTGDVVPPIGNPPHNDAEYFWCVAKAAGLPRHHATPASRMGGALLLDRVAPVR